jgi:hypothetical protein
LNKEVANLEAKCQYLRLLVLPQHTESTSFNQNLATSHHVLTEEYYNGIEIVFMEMERNSPMYHESHESLDNEPVHN